MTCPACKDRGIVPFVDVTNPKADTDVTAADLLFAICCCPGVAHWLRSDENAGRLTGYYGWQVWAAVEQIDPSRVYLLEEILMPDELQAAGCGGVAPGVVEQSREAALLSQGKLRRVRL